MAINRANRGIQPRRRPATPPPPPPPPTPSPPPDFVTPPPSPPYDPMWAIRWEINDLFHEQGFSFSDPNNILERMVALYDAAAATDIDLEESQRMTTTLHRAMDILRAVAQDEAQHRHYVDAANILNEYWRRIDGEKPIRLVPDPRGLVYRGLSTPPSPTTGAGRPVIIPEEFMNYPPKRDKYGPMPRVKWAPQPAEKVWAGTNDEVDENALAVKWMKKFTANASARDAILNILSTEGNDRGLDPPLLMLDDATETVLRLPERMPLLDAATPFTDPAKQNQQNWPLVEAYDSRKGSRTSSRRLLQTNYITKLFATIREMVCTPEVAKKYAIIFRAHPSRFQENTPEQLVDEPAPTRAEVECIIDFFSMAFPVIDVVRTLGKDSDGDETAHAEIHRGNQPNLVNINSIHFDAIEEGLSEGINVGHFFFFILVTITHELGHYLYGIVFFGQALGSGGERIKSMAGRRKGGAFAIWPPESSPGKEYDLDTPRRLRYMVEGGFNRHKYHDDYDPRYYLQGEMGEIIEYLVFGFMSNLALYGNPDSLFRVTCWGSNPYQRQGRIMFKGYVGTKLFMARPPVRMTGPQLRGYIAEVQKEEAIYLAAEKAARVVYSNNLARIGETAAAALAAEERLMCYRRAGGRDMPELIRLRPTINYVSDEVIEEGRTPLASDVEMSDGSAGDAESGTGDAESSAGDAESSAGDPESSAGDAAGAENMDIDIGSDADEHYTAQKIPQGRKFKRYRQCIRYVNAESARVTNWSSTKHITTDGLGDLAFGAVFVSAYWGFITIPAQSVLA